MADPFDADDPGRNSFERFVAAAIAGRLDVLEQMLAQGHDIDLANASGETAFSYCCANDALVGARFLAERGAVINTVDGGGGTPLDWAVCWSSPAFRQWLRSIGGRRNDDHPEWDWPPPHDEEE